MNRDRKRNDLLSRLRRQPPINWFLLAIALGVAIYIGYGLYKSVSGQLQKIPHSQVVGL